MQGVGYLLGGLCPISQWESIAHKDQLGLVGYVYGILRLISISRDAPCVGGVHKGVKDHQDIYFKDITIMT